MAMHEGEEGTEEEVMPGLTEEEAGALAQQLYVAYYGRPADPGGLEFWTGEFMNSSNLDAAITAFGAGAEYEALSAGKTSEELLTSLYQQMFNRDPDMAGLEFYEGRLESGEATLASIAKQVADGAVDEDATTLANKVAVANAFTAAVVEGVVYDAAGISAAAALLAAVDDAEGAVAAGEAKIEDLVALMDGGMAYTLVGEKAGRDLIESGYGDDTYTGTSGTVQDTDAIMDASTDDHDTLTITNTGQVAAISVTNVEYVNIIQDLFDGVTLDGAVPPMPAEGGPEINLSRVKGATVTVSSEKLGYDHKAYVTGVYDNTLVAGPGVTELLIVGDLNDGTVDLGNVKTAMICTINVAPPGVDTEDETGPTVIINGDVNLTVKGSTADQAIKDAHAGVAPEYTLMGAGDAKVMLTAADDEDDDGDTVLVPFTVTGAGDMTLMMASADGAKITNKATGGLMVVSTGTAEATADVSKVESAVTFSGVLGEATVITAADGQMIVFTKAQTSAITVNGAKNKDGSTTANLEVTATDLNPGGITFGDAASASLTIVGADAKATKATVSELNSAATVPVSVASSLKALTVTSLAAANADFSGVDGALSIGGVTVDSEVTGGSGKNTISLGGEFTNTLGYTGGAGVDTLVAANIGAAGRVEAHLGAGNDSIVIRLADADDARLAVDGGAGRDTLVVSAGGLTGTSEAGLQDVVDISTFTRLHMTSVEVLAFAGDSTKDKAATKMVDESVVEMFQVSMSLAQLKPAFIVALADSKVAGGTGADSVKVTVVSGDKAQSIDLSHLVVLDAAKTSFLLTGAGSPEKATTIVGSGGNDVITGTAFDGDILTGGRGADTFVFDEDLVSYRAPVTADGTTPAITLTYDTIMDFRVSQMDILDFNGDQDAVIVGDTDDLATDPGPQDFDATFFNADTGVFAGLDVGDVRFEIEDGVLTLEGLSSNRRMAGTLDEWVLLANAASATAGVLAFEFGGDTYIHEDSGAATTNLIKLEGVRGITLDTNANAIEAAKPDSDIVVADDAVLIA